ncbi:NUDIX hydrolase [Emcibacter sp. SYSU 3D8]|uniref:NUDIX hydrolase n=1 Tax=Emcibacter sp. SYSU 3D8 TaxID=3133969 RepID=UPI0031FEC8DC
MTEKRPNKVELLSRRRVVDGWLKVDEITYRFETFSGGMSDPVTRDIVRRQDAAVGLVRHRSRGTLVFVEQFRPAAHGKSSGWIVEICAGKLDAGESAEQAMRRELTEETGYTALALTPIASYFVSPGYTEERMHLYVIDVDGEPGEAPGDGDEDIRLIEMTPDDAYAWLDQGRFEDSKTLIALYWLRCQP